MEIYEEIKGLLNGEDLVIDDKVYNLEKDVAKFYEKGNSSAGTRVRKVLQHIKGRCDDMRKEVSAIKNG